MYPIMIWKFVYKKHMVSNEYIWFVCIWLCSLICFIVLPTLVAK